VSQAAQQQSTTIAKQRRQAQQERILDAARAEFIKSGFHAASMATIAETAGMSPGLIYRYFKNKNAIILAIIEGQLDIARQRIRDLRGTDDLCAGMLANFDAKGPDTRNVISAALFLEMSAEATRDAEIANAMTKFDREVRSELAAWLQRSRGGDTTSAEDGRLCERALALMLVFAGLKVRKAIEPGLDREVLAEALTTLFEAVGETKD
jgi:AcrR family transcriptional regulator